MSGTSLDGVDLCYMRFEKGKQWSFQILETFTYKYPKELAGKLRNAILLNSSKLNELDTIYTIYLANTINDFILEHRISLIDAICSHGHTVFHQPENGFTRQIGNQQLLADRVDQTVVCDFRIQDVQLGGQGAPLVPVGDRLLFSEFDFCLNLGGFANISFEESGERLAFDICPVNIVMNHYTGKIGQEYDDEGQLARSGSLNGELLKALNALDYYKMSAPKSLGLEWVRSIIFPLVNASRDKVPNVLRTFTEHISIQITAVLNRYKNAKVLVTGGGAYNTFLIERISENTRNIIVIPDEELIDFKEALVFGFLGVLRLRDETNCLSSVTGAERDHSSGNIFHP